MAETRLSGVLGIRDPQQTTQQPRHSLRKRKFEMYAVNLGELERLWLILINLYHVFDSFQKLFSRRVKVEGLLRRFCIQVPVCECIPPSPNILLSCEKGLKTTKPYPANCITLAVYLVILVFPVFSVLIAHDVHALWSYNESACLLPSRSFHGVDTPYPSFGHVVTLWLISYSYGEWFIHFREDGVHSYISSEGKPPISIIFPYFFMSGKLWKIWHL